MDSKRRKQIIEMAEVARTEANPSRYARLVIEVADELRRKAMKWSLAIERKDGEEFVAILREEGKMDTSVDIHREQLPWFNALRELLDKEF